MHSASFESNMMILARTVLELSCGPVRNLVKNSYWVKFDFDGQCQSAPKTIGFLSKSFCIFWAWDDVSSSNGSWVIVQTSEWLSDTRTDGHTDRHTQSNDTTGWPLWPRVTIRRYYLKYSKIKWKVWSLCRYEYILTMSSHWVVDYNWKGLICFYCTIPMKESFGNRLYFRIFCPLCLNTYWTFDVQQKAFNFVCRG